MKTKALVFGILQIIALVIINVFIYNIDKEIYKYSSLIIFGVIAGIIVVLFNGYTIPTLSIFKYRYLFDGILFGIGITLLSRLTHFTDKGTFETAYIVRELTIGLVVGAAVGIVFFSSLRYLTYKRLKKKTPLISLEGEIEILADAARFENNNTNETGRLILTTDRLCYVSAKNGKMIFDISHNDATKDIQINYRSGIPNGIYFADSVKKLYVRFPRLWLKEIEKVRV